ncbi:hypothetical protein HMPREF2609_00580 [Rothia sp. HMSC058E10]|uniref:hypothetical protein n=1 Tax=Rothia sp. HMSC058E10 TaxID=1715088 RepID=UPI0008A10046|nr:hypothetical protein [Rothia sp. HMSC058E10]OFN14563.1 hypothetical protein HMPREF2609_00580 [Rothia sp. HMSC058E10]
MARVNLKSFTLIAGLSVASILGGMPSANAVTYTPPWRIYSDITEIYSGRELLEGPDWQQIIGPGRKACEEKYGNINRLGVYNITFDQHVVTNQVDNVGFTTNLRCEYVFAGDGSGHM